MLALVIYSIFIVSCRGISIGTAKQTRFTSVDRLNSDAVWINNQFSPKQCLCTVLSQYKNTLLFNSYTNGSCQLFLSLPYTYTMEYNMNSTIIFLSPLPPVNQAPCCSDITWLMIRMSIPILSLAASTAPGYMVIDDLDYLAVLMSNSYLYRYNRTTMALNSTVQISSSVALSYYNKQYFITQNSSQWSQLNIYSTANVTNLASISIPYDPSDYVFIRNGTVMVAAINSAYTIAFFNVTSPTSYIPTFNLSAPSKPNTLYRVNDTLLYMATNMTSDPIYTLTYNISTNSCVWGNLSATKSSSTNSNLQLSIDPCGRLLIAICGYGIRIFDTYGTQVLFGWPIISFCGNIVSSKYFDLYVGFGLTQQVISYQSGIKQCTS